MKRRGFVLAAALLVTVLVAAMLAGVFFATMEETQLANGSPARELALIAAETAIATTIDDWTDRTGQQMGVMGEQLSTFSIGELPVAVTITRLDSTLYSIVARAGSPSSHSLAMRRVGVIVRVQNTVDHSILVDPISERWWSELF